jgi:hypothetical protein
MLPASKNTSFISQITPIPDEVPHDLATRIMKWYLEHDGLLIQSFSVEAKENLFLAKIAVENNPMALASVSDALKDNEELVKLAISKNGIAFLHASVRLKADEEIFDSAIFQILETSPELYAEFGLAIIDHCPEYIEKFFPLLSNFKPFIEKAIYVLPLHLYSASFALRRDKGLFDLAFEKAASLGMAYIDDLLRNLACKDLFFLHFLPPEIKKENPALIKACFEEYLENHLEYDEAFLDHLGSDRGLLEIVCSFLPDLFEHAKEEIKGDKDFIMHMIKSCHSRIFEFASEHLQADPDVALLACTEEGGNLFYAKGECCQSFEIVSAACLNEPLAFFFASEEVQRIGPLAADVLNKMGQDFFKLLPHALASDLAFWKGIVEADESLIAFVPQGMASVFTV